MGFLPTLSWKYKQLFERSFTNYNILQAVRRNVSEPGDGS